MTSNELLIIAGAILAGLFAYVPKLADWYKTKDETFQRLFMAGLLLLSTVVVGIFACTEWFPVNVVCDKPGLTGLFVAFVFAIMANQGTYPILPKVGANRQVSKNIILTTEFGRDTVVGMKELGTIADVQPDVPVG